MAFAWSWSALDSFETCPKKHYHTRIKKDYVEPESPQMTWGKQVHDALAMRISKSRRLPAGMPYEEHVEKVLENSDRTQVSTKVEERLAVTEDMTPCQFFDKQADPWCRSVADVLKINEEAGIARLVDWKTGKGKFYPDPVTGDPIAAEPGQLRLGAAIIFAHYPKIQLVWAQYFWLQEGVVTEEIILRDGLSKFWSEMLPRVDKMEQAYRTTEYLPKPSGLCKRHCPVTGCPYHGIGAY